VLFFLCLAILSYILNFNGLYGQDAHEYLRQSRAIFDRLSGLPSPPAELGDVEFAGGYPLLGAIFRFLLGDSVLALQVLSWIAAALGLWVFERLLALLAPGARADSRWAMAGLGVVLAPMFLRASLTSMSDGLGLLFALSTFFLGFRALEKGRATDLMGAAILGAFALSTRYALLALLLPLAVALVHSLISRKKYGSLILAAAAFGVAMLPHFWLKTGGTENLLAHSSVSQWSVLHFFKSSFEGTNGGISRYLLPNLFFLFFPLFHPAFCIALPGLILLAKKTDLLLPTKKILFSGVVLYLILLGGMPQQNLRHLLPTYIMVLLLLFPAWDRFFCYGFLFFKRLATGVLIIALAVQLVCSVQYLVPTISRNRLETEIAQQLRAVLPPNAEVYAFDLDVSLRTYLPEVQFHNLWVQRYPTFSSGHFVLFNEALRPQWQGQNPILNWDALKTKHRLVRQLDLPEGWVLWMIE
jgi:heme exporter protein D